MPHTDEHKSRCDICGAPAGFETSPEGDACAICDQWVCQDHIDTAYMKELHQNATRYGQEYEGIDDICTMCGSERRLPNYYPAPAPGAAPLAVPEWVLAQSVEYALPDRGAATRATARHLIGAWKGLSARTRASLLLRIDAQLGEDAAPTWQRTLAKLRALENELPEEQRAESASH